MRQGNILPVPTDGSDWPGLCLEVNSSSAATRILASWYLLHQELPSYPRVSFPLDKATDEHVVVQDNHYKLVKEMDAANVVLPKNVDGTLPLKKPRSFVYGGQRCGTK